MKKIKPIIKNYKKLKLDVVFKARFMYTKYYENLPVVDNKILIESFMGMNINGSPYYLLLELCSNEKYEKYEKYISAQKKQYKAICKIVEELDLPNVSVVIRHSDNYCKLLAEAKYLINNTTFPHYFIKKSEQVYLNTWHGTALKGLGRSIYDNPNSIGNVQRNFLMSDYLLNSNYYNYNNLKRDYMMEQFYTGKYVISGYPCNDIFFHRESAQKIREELELENKKVIVYMPTWRDKLPGKKHNKQFFYIMHLLFSLEQKLDENTIVYVKLHHLASGKINFGDFEKIRPFPSEYEPYEFLNIADGLITDYSSVMFDFANTGKKIMLYTYDKEEYINTRSMYLNIDDFPFENTDNIEVLINSINSIDNYKPYDEFRNTYCRYDNINSSKQLLDYIFNNKKDKNMEIIDGKSLWNGKKNILIFAGELAKNGLTTALKGLINGVDPEKYNYILTFYKSKTDKNKMIINEFKKEISYIPMQGQKNLTIKEAICQYLYFRLNRNSRFVRNGIKTMFEREAERCFPTMKFDYVIHYTGYERHIMHLLANMDAKKIIFTHNDLLKERKTRNNIHMNSLRMSYKVYDKIAIIRESMKEEILRNVNTVNETKISVAHNLNDIQNIIDKSNDEIVFDKSTFCNYDLEDLKNILDDNNVKKIINIARYSKEKGLDRLVKAFERYQVQNPESYLIIIGGHGNQFNTIRNLVKEMNLNNVILIKSLSNPYPILKKCDLFVLSSHYEGLPMTIMEALILKKPVISTNITGPREFLEKGYGYLVDNSEEGILAGITKFYNGQLGNLKEFDAEKFNKDALSEFYKLIEN